MKKGRQGRWLQNFKLVSATACTSKKKKITKIASAFTLYKHHDEFKLRTTVLWSPLSSHFTSGFYLVWQIYLPLSFYSKGLCGVVMNHQLYHRPALKVSQDSPQFWNEFGNRVILLLSLRNVSLPEGDSQNLCSIEHTSKCHCVALMK